MCFDLLKKANKYVKRAQVIHLGRSINKIISCIEQRMNQNFLKLFMSLLTSLIFFSSDFQYCDGDRND